MKTFIYEPKGVCARKMIFEMEGNIVKEVNIEGGCSGNLQGICRILRNKTLEEVIAAFEGVQCGMKQTSCPDQIAQALYRYQQEQ